MSSYDFHFSASFQFLTFLCGPDAVSRRRFRGSDSQRDGNPPQFELLRRCRGLSAPRAAWHRVSFFPGHTPRRLQGTHTVLIVRIRSESRSRILLSTSVRWYTGMRLFGGITPHKFSRVSIVSEVRLARCQVSIKTGPRPTSFPVHATSLRNVYTWL